MPNRPALYVPTLRKDERERIRRALRRSRDPKFRDRCRAVFWSEQRHSVPAIARLLGVHRTTVQRWIKDYVRFGFRGLLAGKSPGRPRVVDAEAEAAIRAALAKNPREFGYRFTRWTIGALAEHLYLMVHVRIHPETLRRAIKRLRYRYKRPKLSLRHKQDPKAVRKARRGRDAGLKKRSSTLNDSPSSSRMSASSISIPA